MDFIKHIHSKGLLGQNLFYAMKLESVEILYKRNITEIYDFSHLIFLVDKVTEWFYQNSKKALWTLNLAFTFEEVQMLDCEGYFVIDILFL